MNPSNIGDQAFQYSQQGIPIFVGENYELWSVLMRTMFQSHDLWDVVEGSYTKRTAEEEAELDAVAARTHKENKRKDAKALSFMHQGVSRSILPRIISAEVSKVAWDILKKQFGGMKKLLQLSYKIYGVISITFT
jgi:hypothetical protein